MPARTKKFTPRKNGANKAKIEPDPKAEALVEKQEKIAEHHKDSKEFLPEVNYPEKFE